MKAAVLGISFVMSMAALIAAVPQVVDMQQQLRADAERQPSDDGYVQLATAESNTIASQGIMARLVALPAQIMLLFVVIPVIAAVLGLSYHFGRI